MNAQKKLNRMPPLGALFPLGKIAVTPGVLDVIGGIEHEAAAMIRRHAQGDWGDLDEEDIRTNNRGLKEGGRLFSEYSLSTGAKVWVITEADRDTTTVLLPGEY